MAKVTTKFTINRRGIREAILLDSTGTGVERAMIAIANAAKPTDSEIFLSHSYGPAGRLVVWIINRTPTNSLSPSGRARERKVKKEALQAALNRIGGKFRKGSGRKL
jgi:hypothetical protein